MLEFADIFRPYGPAYLQQYGERMLPRHQKAIDDIIACRTDALGGDVYYCDDCDERLYSYHSCGNRHCPKCGADRADRGRDTPIQKLLPVTYFLVTGTLPHELNARARSNQKLISRLLFQISAEAMQTRSLNPEWLGGQIGLVGALHTWDRSMGYHLHVHDVVPAGGIDPETGEWKETHPKFLVPGSALRNVFRAKFRDALKTQAPQVFAQAPPKTWQKTWVVHCKPVGDGKTALKYLTPYIYRVALSNKRLVRMKNGNVTFSYKPRKKPWQTLTRDVMSFMQRFLQHVLPKGVQKVRYFGFLHPNAKTRCNTLNTCSKNVPPNRPTQQSKRTRCRRKIPLKGIRPKRPEYVRIAEQNCAISASCLGVPQLKLPNSSELRQATRNEDGHDPQSRTQTGRPACPYPHADRENHVFARHRRSTPKT